MNSIELVPLLIAGALTFALGVLSLSRSRRRLRIPFATACMIAGLLDFATYTLLLKEGFGMTLTVAEFLSVIAFVPTLFLIIATYVSFEDEGGRLPSLLWIPAMLLFPIVSPIVIVLNPFDEHFGAFPIESLGPWMTVIIAFVAIATLLPLPMLTLRFLRGGDRETTVRVTAIFGAVIVSMSIVYVFWADDVVYLIMAAIALMALISIYWIEFGFETFMTSERLIGSLVRSIGSDAALLDSRGRVILSTGSAMDILGVDDHLVGTSLSEALPPSTIDSLGHVIETGGECIVRGHGPHSSEEYLLKVIMVRADEGSVIGSVVMLVDQTEELERRGLEIANERLLDMTSLMRHDMNNHLMSLGYHLERVAGSSDMEARSHAESGLDILRSMGSDIDLSRTYQDSGLEAPVWLSPHHEVGRAALDLESDVTVRNTCDEDLVIEADMMFRKVIHNLMDNSIRHGGDVTTIGVSSIVDGDELRILYVDDGAGIPEGSKESIFDLGYGDNTGLGLYMARRILSVTDMTIVEDGTDGARFVITVPEGMWRSGGQ